MLPTGIVAESFNDPSNNDVAFIKNPFMASQAYVGIEALGMDHSCPNVLHFDHSSALSDLYIVLTNEKAPGETWAINIFLMWRAVFK